MKKAKAMPVIIGGMVFDIHATATIPATAKSTTPGKIKFMLGGVARNIAECLLKLGTKSFMISALGCDLAGEALLEQWRSAGLPTEGIQRGPDITTASVCNMFDINGDLTAGVASVDTIVTFASPNEHELVAMANSLSHENRFSPIQRDQDKNASIESLFKELKSAIVVLLQKGIKYILVTLGPDGAFLCSGSGPSGLRECLNDTKYSDGKSELFDMVSSRCSTHQYFCSTPCKGGSQLFVMHFPALPAIVRGVSGAGDCLVGGILSSLCSGLDVMQSVAVGVAAAKAAIEAETNVPSTYDLTAVADDAGKVYNAARVVFQESML
ncbi:pseudouridine kinase isoform X4 [Beta vulgaris subsp. vulgaris]|uniref:pseudouridine kinase isoform X4 n=1 Tax=Beta vulgaris subsp. vulgaris TaxID=3555 RepID=UPI002546E3C2|nr:pseudouridine kinase isoform X4 [Beta vulgaris subsp. vulgaris]